MPFDTVERSNKRYRADLASPTADNDWYLQAPTFEVVSHALPEKQEEEHHQGQSDNWIKSHPYVCHSPMEYIYPTTPAALPIDIPYSSHYHTDYFESSSSLSPQSNPFYQDDNASAILSEMTQSPAQHRPSISSSIFSPTTPNNSSPPKILLDSLPEDMTSLINENTALTDVLSKVKFSYSDIGINLEAKVSSASDLRSLIDAFSQLCTSNSLTTTTINSDKHMDSNKDSVDKMLLYRNKKNQTKPVNFFASTCRLGQISNPHSSIESITSLHQLVDACIETYFCCWVRYYPVLQKDEFMNWYHSQERPEDTLIVNAICSYVFRHMVIHHPKDGFEHFLKDQDKLQEQEEYFFSRARECLSQSFDVPDRYTVIALLYMSVRAEPTKRHHYAGMAISALHELSIYPRMTHEDVDCYQKEMDTRLWWYAWAIDFSLWTAGSPKNTPQPRVPGKADLPQVFEQDIDDTETGVISFMHCLKLWQIQADIVAALYDQESAVLTVEQFKEYDTRLSDFYQSLPTYLMFDSGFQYGSEDLFVACLRVNIEYNATLIILHKLFIPEINDTRPSQASLRSLNVCLSTALNQLSAIKTCNMADIARCAFDRDELWRATEVISIAMDIYHTCVSPEDQAVILNGIAMEDFKTGLPKAYEALQSTREYRFSCKNWFQVVDFIEVEIRRHQLEGNLLPLSKMEDQFKKKQPDYFLAYLKPDAKLNNHDPHPHEIELLQQQQQQQQLQLQLQQQQQQQQQQQKQQKQKAVSPSPKQSRSTPSKKPLSFQNQFSIEAPLQSQSSPHVNNTRKSSFSAAPPFVQFNAYVPDQPSQANNGKSPARFRYFNPRKMNKFLFIDEHPMM
ncbi:hypothetical protein EDC96DRAFT_501696 [Choanephora cucurbitarum]|nr:hypothetical protein EDC96DRAFT_501696 [Choanephora cucurbitarum]